MIVNHKNISLYGAYLFWKGDFMGVVEWKDIVGIQGIPDFRYLISNNGDVMYRKTGTILSKRISNRGYFMISINNHLYTIHRLVAVFFVPGRSEKRNEVNHKDGCKLNNWWTNLEWVTKSENIRHAYSLGIMKAVSGDDSPHATILESDVDKICKLLLEYNGSMNDVLEKCDELGIKASYQMIQQIKHKQSWVQISDKWFDENRFAIKHWSEDDVNKICESLVKHDGNINDVIDELKDDVPYLIYGRIACIKNKTSHVKISDKYFKSFIK